MKTKISPSILACDFSDLANEIAKIEKAGADYIHLDVMDGHFVPNISMGPPIIKMIRKCSKLPFDVHLMIDDPIKYAAAFIAAGADIITFHIESPALQNSAEKVKDLLQHIKSKGVKCGLVVKPKTAPESILPYIAMLDMVLVMTVEPGFGGQSFMSDMLPKIQTIRQYADQHNPTMELEVDGGIVAESGKLCREVGADVLVAGTYIFKAEDTQAAINSLR